MTEIHESRGFAGGLIITGVSLVLAAAFEHLVFGKLLGIGFPLFVLLILAGGFALTKKKRFEGEFLWVLIPLLFFSWMVFVRTSELLTVLNVFATGLLLLLLADLLTGKKLRSFILREYAKVVFLPLRFIRPFMETASDIVSLRGVHRHSEVIGQILKGILMAVPVLILFAILFASADMLFNKYISDLLTFDIEEETVARIVRFVILTCVFTGAFSFSLRAAETSTPGHVVKKRLTVGVIQMSIFLGAINVLFLLFILVQLVYLFGGEENVVVEGFTYAEYARKGFFELIAVAVFSFLLLLATEQTLPKKENSHTKPFKVLSGVLVLQVLIIMFSALKRLSLYEAAYGFTTLRLYSHAFIFLLAVIFCIFLYKIFIDTRENTFAFRVFLATMSFLVLMNLLNPDAFIARQNIKLFAETSGLDTDYLSTLSDDALPETIDVLLKDKAAEFIYAEKLDRHFEENSGYSWQSINIARIKAQNLLRPRFEY